MRSRPRPWTRRRTGAPCPTPTLRPGPRSSRWRRRSCSWRRRRTGSPAARCCRFTARRENLDNVPSPRDIERGNMRKLLLAIVCAATLSSLGGAKAQHWPTRPVTMVVPYAAGGTTDVIGRILSPRLSEILGQQVIVENMGGAGGMTGASRVAKAAPDGYQFILGNVSTHAQNQTLYKQPLYSAVTDFAPVILLVDQPMVLIARNDLPADNLQQFIAYAKANQAKMQYGSAGAGAPTHLSCALLNAAIGINVTHVPYRGGGPAMQDLIAGRIDYLCLNAASSIPQIEGKTVKGIAILTKNRSPSLPNLASAQEQGLKDFTADNW